MAYWKVDYAEAEKSSFDKMDTFSPVPGEHLDGYSQRQPGTEPWADVNMERS